MKIHRLQSLLKTIMVLIALQTYAPWLAAQANGGVTAINKPIAYCLSSLKDCTADNQKTISDKAPHDLRALNGGTQDPVTLVYSLPKHEASTGELGLLIRSRYSQYDFQFNTSQQIVNNQFGLTVIPIPDGATQLLAQSVKRPDARITRADPIWGTMQAIQKQIQSERESSKLLTGWYLFVGLAAMFQLITKRNRRLSLFLLLLVTTVMCRIHLEATGWFYDIDFLTIETRRVLELLTIPLLCIFLIEYFAVLVNRRWKRIRYAFHCMCGLVALLVIFAQQPDTIFISLRLAQYLMFPAAALALFYIVVAVRTTEKTQSVVILCGFFAVATGSLLDLYTTFNGTLPLGRIGFGPYCFAFESLCQYILIALRNEAAHHETLAAQNLAAQAQTEALLAKAHIEAQQAHNEALQIQAELARKEAEHAQIDSENAQTQLQQADKMASLGQLVASVTHEINTPIGAIQSSGSSITDALSEVIVHFPPLLQKLDSVTSQLLIDLLLQANQPKAAISSREERAIIKRATEVLEAANIELPRPKAALLVNLNVQANLEKYLPLLQHHESEKILDSVRNFSSAMGNARNVNIAVERVGKIVKALKSFSHFNVGVEKIEANLTEGMETVLTIYQGQTKVGVEVVRNYEEIPPLLCFPDELNQVWTNLIHNALQAMNHEGTLTIGIRKEGDCAMVSVSDSGCGIPEQIRSKIFDVFFTTKPAGVGSGLGLDIVKKIIQKHNGRIDLQSEVNVGTTFTVTLPYNAS
jgi:signal transduction histidine kinase